jgi:pimeloyl-ACP methyl ester carboxylesterase
MANSSVGGHAGPAPASRAGDVHRAVEAAGPDRAPALVLLHGTRRTRAMWHHQLGGLADDFRVVVVDLPGHGALADVPFRLADATELVSAVIDLVAGGRAIVVGQSLGGYVGMDLAARRPGQVAGLVLANATAEPRSIVRRAPRQVGSYLAAAAGERIRWPRAVPPGDGPAGSRRPGADPAPEVPATHGWLFKGGTRALVAALGETFIPRLAAYPGPTLLINGAEDRLFRHAEQAFLAAAANGRLEVIPGCGHLVNEDQPAAFNTAVRRFAAEIDGSALP